MSLLPYFHHRCSLPGCKKPARTGKICGMHRERWKRNKSYELLPRARPGKRLLDPIRKNVEDLRVINGWTVRDLRTHSGVGLSFMSLTTDPSLETLRALGAAFNVQYWRLLIPGEFNAQPPSQLPNPCGGDSSAEQWEIQWGPTREISNENATD